MNQEGFLTALQEDFGGRLISYMWTSLLSASASQPPCVPELFGMLSPFHSNVKLMEDRQLRRTSKRRDNFIS